MEDIKLSKQEENLIRLMREVPEGSIKEIKIKDGQPVTAEEIKMKIDLSEAKNFLKKSEKEE